MDSWIFKGDFVCLRGEVGKILFLKKWKSYSNFLNSSSRVVIQRYLLHKSKSKIKECLNFAPLLVELLHTFIYRILITGI